MAGKGKKRREKNYRAAHGGHSRLPPPPVRSQLDTLPSKLRKIISFTTPKDQAQSQGSVKVSEDRIEQRKKKGDADNQKKPHLEDEFDWETTGIIDGGSEGDLMELIDGDGDTLQNSTNEKRKKKRKRKQVEDLRFETTVEESGTRLKRRERKKKYLEARKKKHQKGNTEENLNFRGCEEIKFGEVVDAPPKLNTFPKALKSVQDASKERLRLQAIESYRNRKGWTSRPGINLPPPVTTSSSF